MKSTDLRAKARAIFGSAIAEPMPNQPNGAKALQQRANARPIPTYKVGGVIKKADGGSMPKLSTAERKMGDALMMKRKGKEVMDAQKRMESDKDMMRRKKQEAADKLLGIRMKNGGKAGCYAEGGKPLKFDPKKEKPFKFEPKKEKPFKFEPKPEKPFKFTGKKDGGSVEKKADGGLLDRVGRAISDIANEGKTKKYGITVGGVPRGSAGRPARNKADGAGSGSNAPVTVARREESVTVNPNPPKEKPKYVKLNEKPKYVKLNAHKDGGKVQTSADTAKKLATEMGGMKKGGKAKDGLAVMIAIGKVKKPAKKMGGGMMYADGGKPEKMAVGGAGKTRKGQAPIKKAQGGVATYQGGGKATQKKITPEEGEATRQRLLKLYGATGAAKKAAQEAKDARDGGFNSVAEYRRWLETAAYNTGVARGEIKDKAHGGVMKKAQGGAAKVRKGMMSPTGDIKQVVKPKKGLGGM